MNEEERFRLHFGPYKPPRIKVGDEVECAVRGFVIVAGWTEAPLTWPYHRASYHPPIVFGSLLAALKEESNVAVAHWWGVTPSTVGRWRGLLGINGYKTPGCKRLYRAWMPEKLTPEVNTAPHQSRRGCPQKTWTPEDDAQLGTAIDREVAALLGRSAHQVRLRRCFLEIPPFNPMKGKCHRDNPDLMTLDTSQLRPRRMALGLTQAQVAGRVPMHANDYSMLEVGNRWRIYRTRLENLAKALECKPEDLIRST